MANRYEMRFTGSGGQGVILASVILAEAAVIAGQHAVQSQAYGPEARGGLCKAETVISSGDILFTKVMQPDFLLAMTQGSLEKYIGNTAENAVVLMDAELTLPQNISSLRVVSLPVLETARVEVGKLMTANIVAVGAINALLGLFDRDILLEAVRRHIPKGTEALNEKALAAGQALVSEELAAQCKVTL